MLFFIPEIPLMAPLLFLACSIILLMLSYRCLLRKNSNLPPSPPGLPIIGNLHQLSSLPHRSLRMLSQKHGPLMFIRLGLVPALVVSSADAACEVLKTHDASFASRPITKASRKLTFGSGRNIGFSPYGDYWRQAKKISSVHLLSVKRVKSFSAVREEAAAVMLEKISSSAAAGNAVDLSQVLHDYSNDVICKAAAGKFATADKFQEIVRETSELMGGFQVYDTFPAIGWLSTLTGMDAKLDKLVRKREKFLTGILAEHARLAEKRESHGGDEKEEEEDFVDILLKLQKQSNGSQDFVLAEEDIKALVMGMFAAGTDTSYVFLEWTMAELLRNSRAMRRAQGEVRDTYAGKPTVTEDDLSQMSYFQATIKEAMRLHPPAPLLLPHESTEQTQVQGYVIPAKTRVIVNAWAIGRDPNSWENAEEFRPERFLGSTLDFSGCHFKLIPFGAGRRICPGMNFAVSSIEFALAKLLYHFDWKLPEGMDIADLDMDETPGLVTRKKSSLRLVATEHF